MSKRANGEGTICKRSDGRWVSAVTIGTNKNNGKPIRRYFYGKSQKEVKDKLQAFTSELENDTYIKTNNITVGEWVNIWLDTYCVHVKPTTLNVYKSFFKNHIKKELGKLQLQKLKIHDVQSFINSLDVSPRSIRYICSMLNNALNKAVKLGYIKINPCSGVTLPKPVKNDVRALNDDEIKRLFENLKNTEYYNFYKLALYTGLRRSELIGLTWDCFNEELGALRVYRQLQYINGVYTFNTPKNGKARTVVLPNVAIELLESIKADSNSNFIFADKLGKHLKRGNVSNSFKRACVEIGLIDVSLHVLRHTYAVNALRSGDNIKSVQNNLGHSTPSFTLEQYISYTNDMFEESRKKLQSFFKSLKV